MAASGEQCMLLAAAAGSGGGAKGCAGGRRSRHYLSAVAPVPPCFLSGPKLLSAVMPPRGCAKSDARHSHWAFCNLWQVLRVLGVSVSQPTPH